MRKKRFTLLIPLLFLAMLLLLVGSLLFQEAGMDQITFRDDRRGLKLSAYYAQAEDAYYLYLPSFLSPEELRLSYPEHMTASLSQDLTEDTPSGTELQLTISSLLRGEQTYRLKLMRGSARQVIFLEAKEGTMEQLDSDQTQERSVSVRLLQGSGETVYQGYSDLSGRGNGTWQWPKKPYDLQLPEAVDFGPFEDVEKLCLLAECTDDSKLRNALGYRIGKAMEIPYASDYAYADIYINGQYHGLYGLATKREYTKYIQSDSIQAVFELSGYQKGDFFHTEANTVIRTYHGSQALVQTTVNTFEQALLARDWEVLYRHMDLASWARKYAMDELLGNYDLALGSEYYYLGSDGLIRCMLPWDYEWIVYARMSPFDFRDEQALAAWWNPGSWYDVLLESDAFRAAVQQVLTEEFTPEFLADLSGCLSECIAEMGGSWQCDLTRWYGSVFWYDIAPAEAPGLDVYQQELTAGLAARLDYLRYLFDDWDNQCRILFQTQIGDYSKWSNLQLILPKGGDLTAYCQRILDTLVVLESYPLTGCYDPSGIPLEQVSTVTEDVIFTAVYDPVLPGASAGNVPAAAGLPQTIDAMLSAYAVPLGILGCFLAAFLVVALQETKALRRRPSP